MRSHEPGSDDARRSNCARRSIFATCDSVARLVRVSMESASPLAGWLFDGLDMHLYVLVATPFVA